MAAVTKKRKVSHLGNILDIRGVTDSALVRLLVQIKQHPEILDQVPACQQYARKLVGKHIRQDFIALEHQCWLTLVDGGKFRWRKFSVVKLLEFYSLNHSIFKRHVGKLLELNKVLTAVLYHDEIVPGNALRPANGRKFTAFYLSFLELGLALRSETSWLPIAVLRSSVAHDVKGGMSAVVAQLVQDVFVGPGGLDEGALIFSECGRGSSRLKASMGRFLFDEAAMKATFSVKGASGIKPCMVCKNVLMKAHPALLHNQYFVDITTHELEKLDLNTNNDLWETFDNLIVQQNNLTKTNFEELQKASGMTFVNIGILSPCMRHLVEPVEMTTFDSMHTYFQGGVAGVEIHLCLETLQSHSISFAMIRSFAEAGWREPANSTKRCVSDVLSDIRERLTDSAFKGGASELLAVIPMVVHFVEAVVMQSELADSFSLEFRSLVSLYQLVSVLQMCKDFDCVPAPLIQRLAGLQRQHLQHHKAAHGSEHLKPKHHFSLHIPAQIARDGILLDTFVLERKHKFLKRIGSDVHVAQDYEMSVLSRALQQELCKADEESANERTQLLGSSAPWLHLATEIGCRNVIVAQRIRHRNATLKVDDVVIIDGQAKLICCCLMVSISNMFDHSV